MTHLQMFLDILTGQQERGIREKLWDQAAYEISQSIFHGCTEVKIRSSEIIFMFNRNGRFVGILNYKK